MSDMPKEIWASNSVERTSYVNYLKAVDKEKRGWIDGHQTGYILKSEYDDIVAKLEKAKEVLRFYGDATIYLADLAVEDSTGRPYFDFKCTPIHNESGRKARECLKELDK